MSGPVSPTPTADEMAQQAAALVAVTTSPAFLEILHEIEAEPEAQRMQKAQQLATVDTMRARGIPVPAGVRLTTRYFEDPAATQINAQLVSGGPAESAPIVGGPSPRPSAAVCVSGGFFVCVSVGREFQ
jgi:hypothetical protein